MIAGELEAADRPGEALEWVENGLRHAAAEGEPVHRGLVDYLAERYAGDGRTADALTVRRDHFRAEHSLHAYRALRAAARADGRWDAERPPALELLRADAGEGRRNRWGGGPVLIDALTDALCSALSVVGFHFGLIGHLGAAKPHTDATAITVARYGRRVAV
ncbi:hypothetical protein ABZ370_22910 [Streptomyces sp. NPDC005962]|uniref:hypothetical protein n=1 Tax=Streptomyces sp. NPDC005962 TaxID=3154466 RepID=UPI0033F8FA19